MGLSFRKRIEYSVLYNSMIGKFVEIVDSTNEGQIGIKGYLVWESSKQFHILTLEGHIKKIFKNTVTLRAEVEGKLLNIDGRLLISTISNRIKKMK